MNFPIKNKVIFQFAMLNYQRVVILDDLTEVQPSHHHLRCNSGELLQPVERIQRHRPGPHGEGKDRVAPVAVVGPEITAVDRSSESHGQFEKKKELHSAVNGPKPRCSMVYLPTFG